MALLSGLADIDAATLFFASAANREMEAHIAVTAIILLVLSNSHRQDHHRRNDRGRQDGAILALPLLVALVVGVAVALARVFGLA